MSVPAEQLSRTAIKAKIKRGEAAGRRQMRGQLREDLAQVERIYRQAADDIEREIRNAAGTDNNLRIETLQTLLDKIRNRLQGLSASRDELLRTSMKKAARIGVSPFQEVPGISEDLANISHDAVKFVQTFVAEDGLQLSDRLWRVNRGAREAVAGAVEQAVTQGHSASRAARDFMSRGQDVPASVRDKVDAADADRVAHQAGRALLRADNDRSAYQNALRVFRTEINRAHGHAFRAAAFEQPDVVGTRFLLSPAHPKPDICDMHARVNLYGMGPGVYPKGKSPWPAHPNTLSFEEVVFRDEITQADNKGREDRISWLKKQPPGIQEAVLGGRKKRAALQRGILTQGEIGTPWNVLKERYRRRGIDTDSLEVTPPSSPPPPPPPAAGIATLEPHGEARRTTDFFEKWNDAGTFNNARNQEVLQRFHAPAEIPANPRRTAYQVGHSIHMGSYAPDTLKGRAVMRHETGHFVDQKIGDWMRQRGQGTRTGFLYSGGEKGTAAMRADQQRLIDKQKAYYNDARDRHPELKGRRFSKNALAQARSRDRLNFVNEAGGPEEALKVAKKELADGKDLLALVARESKLSDNALINLAIARRHGDITVLPDLSMRGHPSGIMMNDLVGALTKNRVGFGHPTRYYDQAPGMRQTEGFANAFDLLDYAEGSLPRLYLREMTPNWLKFINDTLEEVVNAG